MQHDEHEHDHHEHEHHHEHDHGALTPCCSFSGWLVFKLPCLKDKDILGAQPLVRQRNADMVLYLLALACSQATIATLLGML